MKQMDIPKLRKSFEIYYPCCNYPSLTFLPNFILCDLIDQTLIEIRLNIANLFLNLHHPIHTSFAKL